MSDLIRTTAAKPPALKLASVVARAKAALPAETGAVARAAARPDLAILADVSASMGERAGTGRKVDALASSLASVLADAPAATTIAFATLAVPVPAGAPLPAPSGGTALHLALEAGADHRRLLVISDGQPDSADQALRVAERVAQAGVRIDTLFIGSDGDREAIAFMRRLAQIGRGETLTCDIVRQRGDRRELTGAIRRLALAAPGAGR